MTGLPNLGFDIFDKNRDFLVDRGWDVVSPADIDRAAGLNSDKPFTEEQYNETIKRDYAALLECGSIAFMNNWINSKGAKLESDFANVLKLDRYRVDVDNLYFEKEIVIGLTGYARSGKDSIAHEFVTRDGFQRIGFADALKEILYGLNPIIEITPNMGSYIRIQQIINNKGWEEAKKLIEIRELLQRLGTEGGRASLGEDVWINTLFNSPTVARIVIPDVRFANEAAEIKRRGGKVIKIIRPGIEPANDHPSEQIDFDVDFTIQNNRTPTEAYLEIVEQLHKFEITL
jgi:hypothetical protein